METGLSLHVLWLDRRFLKAAIPQRLALRAASFSKVVLGFNDVVAPVEYMKTKKDF